MLWMKWSPHKHPFLRSPLCLLIVAALMTTLLGCTTAPAATATPVSSPTPLATATLAAATPLVSEAVPVTVRQLIDSSAKYSDHSVSLTGKIILECPEGCWFFLDDGTGKLYIDIKPAGLTIPQKVGSRVTLTGKISGSGGNLKILGDSVKFLDEAN